MAMPLMAKRWLTLALLLGWLGLGSTDFQSIRFSGTALAEEEECNLPPQRWQVSSDYLVFWLKSAQFPALATTGNSGAAIPGALGQPGTVVLAGGGLDHGSGSAGKFGLAHWLDPGRTLSLEANYFIAEQQSFLFSASSDGGPKTDVLARPYFDPFFNEEFADPRAFPNLDAGSINFTYMTRIMGAEGNARYDLQGMGWQQGLSCSVLGGVRFLRLDEKYVSFDSRVELPAGTSDSFFISDAFTTYNQFYGGQLGARCRFRWDRDLFLDVEGKLAVGPNFQRVRIGGLTTVENAAGSTSFNQGLFAQPTNIGQYRQRVVAVLPEITVNLNWDLCENLRVKVGYTNLYVNHVVRPGEQIDRVLNNPQVLGNPNPEPPPVFSFRETSIWLQAVNVGLEFTF